MPIVWTIRHWLRRHLTRDGRLLARRLTACQAPADAAWWLPRPEILG